MRRGLRLDPSAEQTLARPCSAHARALERHSLWAYGDLVEEGLSEGLSEYLPPSPPSATRGGGALASDEHSEKSALFVLLLFTAAELLCLIASISAPPR